MFDRRGRVNNCEVVSVRLKGLQGFQNARFVQCIFTLSM